MACIPFSWFSIASDFSHFSVGAFSWEGRVSLVASVTVPFWCNPRSCDDLFFVHIPSCVLLAFLWWNTEQFYSFIVDTHRLKLRLLAPHLISACEVLCCSSLISYYLIICLTYNDSILLCLTSFCNWHLNICFFSAYI